MSKRRPKRTSLAADLYNQKAAFERFRDRVNELKSSVKYCRKGNKLYYSVDFSEIYSYLHYGDTDVKNFGVNVTPTVEEGQAKAEEQHYLALTHLFNSFSPTPLYLLQPYLLEMYSYARTHAHRSRKHDLLLSDLLAVCADSLKPEHKRLLQSINDPESLTEEQKKGLLDEMASDYPKLSIDLLEYDRWREQNIKLINRGQLLKTMLTKRKISHRIDEMLEECGIANFEVMEPLLEEEQQMAAAFPSRPGEDEERKFSRLIDARAVLLLRNLNRLLEPKNARLILITRDSKSPKIAETLENEEWFGWKKVRKYFYGIETVYLHLILHPKDDDQKLEWLEKADSKLSDMLRSVEQVLEEARENELHSPTKILSAGTKGLLEQNSEHWNKLIEVEFIRTSPAVDWLGEDFVKKRLLAPGLRGEIEGTKGIKQNQISLLRNLVTVVDSNEFQAVAKQDAHHLWTDITLDVVGMNSLGKFRGSLNEVLEELKRLFDKSSSPMLFKMWVARSVSFTNMPTINFVNKAYQEFIKNFKPWSYQEDQILDQIANNLAELFARALGNLEKPENWLFMAFLMGMLDDWNRALALAKRGRDLMKDGDRREFEYFLAYARCREVLRYPKNHRDALKLYASANKHILRALKCNPYDPRFLKRQGTIALQYHERRRNLLASGEHDLAQIDHEGRDIVSEAQAIQLLVQAERRAGGDRKLRVRVLNNLAFTYGTSDPPLLDKATHCVEEIQKEFDFALGEKDGSLPEPEKWPFVVDTIWYIRGKNAFINKDASELESTISQLQGILEKAVLLEHERTIIESHLQEAQGWRQELQGADVKVL